MRACVCLILGVDGIEEQRVHYIYKEFGTILVLPRCLYSLKNEVTKDKEHVKGAADKTKGAVKDAAGKVTGDQELQAEGKIDKAKGAAHNVAGNVKDAARDASKETKKD
jgi:uncharacterized protein YjbJ (UPF0337 family)